MEPEERIRKLFYTLNNFYLIAPDNEVIDIYNEIKQYIINEITVIDDMIKNKEN